MAAVISGSVVQSRFPDLLIKIESNKVFEELYNSFHFNMELIVKETVV